jgi:hypothetical protein
MPVREHGAAVVTCDGVEDDGQSTCDMQVSGWDRGTAVSIAKSAGWEIRDDGKAFCDRHKGERGARQ